MPAKKKKQSKTANTLILSFITAIVLSLSVYNFSVLLSPAKNNVVYAYQDAPPLNQRMIKYWNDFLTDHPGYLPGWLELARLELEDQDVSNALIAINKAKMIDPNSEVINEILDQIETIQTSK